VDRDLLDMGGAVDLVGDQICDGEARSVRRHPGAALPPVAVEQVERRGFVVGDHPHAEGAERFPGCPLDVLEQGEFGGRRRPDTHGHTHTASMAQPFQTPWPASSARLRRMLKR
jgi:hypothetical protein